jgi:hypothetical protein
MHGKVNTYLIQKNSIWGNKAITEQRNSDRRTYEPSPSERIQTHRSCLRTSMMKADRTTNE